MNNIITQEQKDNIDQLCNKYKITKYTINGDLTIDVDGDVNFFACGLTRLPLMFNKVSGTFECGDNYLITLQFSPNEVGDSFYCSGNMLTSLEYCPKKIGKHFSCWGNNLKSLEHCPSEVGGAFDCSNNELTTLHNISINVGREFFINDTYLPEELVAVFTELTDLEMGLFIKYQAYYDVWTPELDLDGAKALVAELKDGLR
jgi:hypothetical protein